jgi:hypothetical protein
MRLLAGRVPPVGLRGVMRTTGVPGQQIQAELGAEYLQFNASLLPLDE